MAGDDKHMFKQFCQEGQPHVLEALSPPQTTGISPSRYRGLGGSGCSAAGAGIPGGNEPALGAGVASTALGWLLHLFLV